MQKIFRFNGFRQRGLSIIEVMIAMVVLIIAFLMWTQGALVATQAENKASNHTQAIAIADHVLETMRRDPEFWASEYTPGCVSGNCWTQTSPSNVDECGQQLPAYKDADPTQGGTWHAQTCTVRFPAVRYAWAWRADVHGYGGTPDTNAADLTVWLKISLNGRNEIYKVQGITRYL